MEVKHPNSILVPVSLQFLDDVKAWFLRLDFMLMLSGLAVHCSFILFEAADDYIWARFLQYR